MDHLVLPSDSQGIASVFVERRDWGRAANCKHRLARATKDAAERKAYFLEAADIWEKRARQPHRAAVVLDEAMGKISRVADEKAVTA